MITTHTSDGSQVSFPINIPFNNKEDVQVYIDNSLQTNNINIIDNDVIFSSPPNSGAVVGIECQHLTADGIINAAATSANNASVSANVAATSASSAASSALIAAAKASQVASGGVASITAGSNITVSGTSEVTVNADLNLGTNANQTASWNAEGTNINGLGSLALANNIDGQNISDTVGDIPFSRVTEFTGGQTWKYLHITEEFSQGTAPQLSGTNISARLNTVKTNEITGAYLSSYNITLPAGTYYISGYMMGYRQGRGFKAFLRNNNTNSVLLQGSSAASQNQGSADVTANSFVNGKIVLTSTTSISLRCTSQYAGYNLGYPANFAGHTEIFAEFQAWRLN